VLRIRINRSSGILFTSGKMEHALKSRSVSRISAEQALPQVDFHLKHSSTARALTNASFQAMGKLVVPAGTAIVTIAGLGIMLRALLPPQNKKS
jgi:hypothetical protein